MIPSNKKLISYPSILLFSFFFILFFIRFYYTRESYLSLAFNIENIFIFILSYLSFLLYSISIDFLCGTLKKTAVFLKAVLVLFSYILGVYFIRSNAELDYTVISENIGLLFYSESHSTIAGKFDFIRTKDFILGFFTVCLLFFFEMRSRPAMQRSLTFFSLTVGLYTVIVINLNYSYEFTSSFVNKIYTHHFKVFHLDTIDKKKISGLNIHLDDNSVKKTPNILMILIESFNSNFVQSTTTSGLEPVFYKLRDHLKFQF